MISEPNWEWRFAGN